MYNWKISPKNLSIINNMCLWNVWQRNRLNLGHNDTRDMTYRPNNGRRVTKKAPYLVKTCFKRNRWSSTSAAAKPPEVPNPRILSNATPIELSVKPATAHFFPLFYFSSVACKPRAAIVYLHWFPNRRWFSFFIGDFSPALNKQVYVYTSELSNG